MDKSWINSNRTSNTFRDGVKNFIDIACVRGIRGSIVCPCVKCCNDKWLKVETVHSHLLRYGFLPGYTTWTFHEEHCIPSPQSQLNSVQETSFVRDDITGLVRDALGINSLPISNERLRESTLEEGNSESAEKGESYKKLLEECDKELYPGCKYSNLSFTLHLYHIKCIGGISNKAFGMLLELLRDAFPHLKSLPSSVNEAKKLTNDLGLGYEKIHACPNDYMLYWGEREGQQACHVCKAPRYKSDMSDDVSGSTKSLKSKKPAKVLRYFPLIPRLKRLYMSEKTSKDMRWHEMGLTKDGKLRHPADGLAWKAFDSRYPEFASDPRSVRLGLASDGFNPFRRMSTTYSTWPVLLIPYNLPPWICMKQQSFILSAIIPGEKAPENDIDIYLKPLIHELKLLWEGVDAYDAFSKQEFKLRASLLWTVNDFPAYANLSGWSTKGRVACPICANSTRSLWLKYGKKFCYMGHRRWLEKNHNFRFQKDRFDGTIEEEGPPHVLSGSDILKQLRGASFRYGKSDKQSKKRTRDDVGCSTNVSLHTMEPVDESSAFEDTENFIQEDIDGENQLWKKKSIFFDLPYWEHNVLRHNLDVMHIEKNVCDNVLGTLLNLDGKSKDNENTRKDLMEMGIRHELHLISRRNRKPYLPPACYTMSNIEKLNFLQVLKNLKVPDGYASNISRGVSMKDRKLFNLKSHDGHILMQDILPIALKASMPSRAQSRIVKVVSDFCSFFKGLCAKVLDLGELDNMGNQVVETLCELEQLFPPSFFTIMVHLTIHLISEAKLGGPVQPFRNHFLGEQQSRIKEPLDLKTMEKLLVEEFSGWLRQQVTFLERNKCDTEVLSLATGPSTVTKQYKGFIINGFRFLTKSREEFKKTQNSGVVVEVESGNYYGKLTDIIELEYFGGYKVVLFRCDWVDIRPSRGLKKDKYGLPLVNFSRPLIHTGEALKDDPFVISSQARQVFYVEDAKDVGWSHVVMTKPRDVYDMGSNVNRDDDDLYTETLPFNLPILDDINEEPHWHRTDIEIEDD